MKSSSFSGPNWKQVLTFLGITFALTWALDLILQLTVGYAGNPTIAALMLQLQMLIPASVAIALGMFAFRDSPLHISKPIGKVRIFLYAYLAYTVYYIITAVILQITGGQQIYSQIALGVTALMLVFLVILRFVAKGDTFNRVGLGFGHPKYWLIYGLGIFLLYALTTGLNALFGIGSTKNMQMVLLSMPGGMPPVVVLLILAIQTILIGPFLGLMMGFGEEYGWRGYLQSELIKMGKKRGILLLGIIWGIWHWPIIWMGHNYPGEPVWGTLLMTVYTVFLGFILGYAVLKTGSVWLAAFLHALNNQAAGYFMGFIYTPDSAIFSFSMGVYMLIPMLVILFFILRDPIWKDEPASVIAADAVPTLP